MPTDLPKTVLFFDGVCGLCNLLVDYLVERDHERRLRYAPLQGETFQAVARENPQLAGIDSLVVAVRDEPPGATRLLVRSRGALYVFAQLGGWWTPLARLLMIVPAPLTDLGYRLVARMRYLIFGRRNACRLPSPSQHELFLP